MNRFRIAILCVASLLVALGLILTGTLRRSTMPGGAGVAEDVLYSNTARSVDYVGSTVCRDCHTEYALSYDRTGMGRSMGEVDAGREPPDAVFDHPLSHRRYQVYRKDGQIWHRELLLNAQSPAESHIVLAEYPLKYVVGSGRHSLTYLAEAEGFLVESPLTWYASRKAWGMSPGYNHPQQVGFERATGEGCLYCHAGQVHALDRSLHKMQVLETAIGCERCHGPGALHVQRHANRRGPADRDRASIDETIVNPAHLSRELSEAVCQQCHLRSTATILTPGKRFLDFRPGLRLQDFRHDYAVEAAHGPMTVVGHVEQLHLSRCYQSNTTLTCLTCHNPHHEPQPDQHSKYYSAICRTCHGEDDCQVDIRRRDETRPANDCVQCHMPNSPTEIPHLAFTHHRIGIHDRNERRTEAAPAGHRSLRLILEPTNIDPTEQAASLGQAYLEAANRESDNTQASQFQTEALELLTRANSGGAADPDSMAALARLKFDLGLPGVVPLAESALTHPALSGQSRCNALFLVADGRALERRHQDAINALRELTQLRRHSVDWLLLADCERALGHDEAAIDALLTAVRINPRLVKVHQHLAEHFRRRGDLERATWHQERVFP